MAEAPPSQEGPLLKRGASGDQVRQLQTLLSSKGIADLEVDGIFGRETEAAVRRFQESEKLAPDGLVGGETWRRLDEVVPSRAPPAPKAADVPRRGRDLRQLDEVGPIAAAELVLLLLGENPELDDRASGIAIAPPAPNAERLPVSEWIGQLQTLFDPIKFVPDARLELWGLALLEPEVGKACWADGFLEGLVDEVGGEELLTAEGHKCWEILQRKVAPKDIAAPTLLDRPAQLDQLGRRAFAIALAARLVQLRATYRPRSSWTKLRTHVHAFLTRIREALASAFGGSPERPRSDGPFLVHLQGAWGVGKTSLLNFLSEQLRRPTDLLNEAVWGPEFRSYPHVRPWVVVEFNAWQHQRVAPPWWWLMTAVYHKGGRSLPPHKRILFRLRDYWWRFWSRWPAFVVPALALIAIGSGLWYIATQTNLLDIPEDEPWYKHMGGMATALSAAAALAVTLAAAVRAVKGWALVGTARGAETFLATTTDPLAFVQRRYEHLVRTLRRPLVVVIDDLDRCRSDYVVQLLEGIHTLFARSSVTYVVAADGRWLRQCFANEYKDFATTEADPGRPLGDRFLEKTFQLSTSVPVLYPEVQKLFLDRLLTPHGGAGTNERSERSDAAEEARALSSEQEFRVAVNQSAALPATKRAAVREALVVRASAVDVVRETEYLLAGFHHLLEPNPRAMKRIVNAYGFEAKLELLERDWVEDDSDASSRLALWTIARLRWPALAEHLLQEPDHVEAIRSASTEDRDCLPGDLQYLCGREEVRRVFTGAGVDAELRAEDIRAFARGTTTVAD
jgi:hypothetical protein